MPSKRKIKESILELVLELTIYGVMICPVWFIEPTYKGKDPSQYSVLAMLYMLTFIVLGCIGYMQIAKKIARVIIKKKFKLNRFKMSKETNKFNVEIINPEESALHLILGISEERSDEMLEIVKESYKKGDYFSDTLKEVTAQMENINEVVFATLLCGRMHDGKKDGGMEKKLKELEMLLDLMKLRKNL